MATSRRWADLGTRTVSALVLAPVAIAAIWVGGWAFVALVVVAAAGMAWEWAALVRRTPPPNPLPQGEGGLLVARSRPESPLPLWEGAGGGVLIALWAALLIWLRADPLAGRVNVIGLVLIVWATDIGAYAVGRLIGGPRLAPRISPGKTWAGALGGLAAAVGIAIALAAFQPRSGGFALAAGIGLLLSAAGQAGDLAESALKRRCGVKDSGHLIPGHGGLLDRLDATLAVVPVVALLCFAFGRGVVLWQ